MLHAPLRPWKCRTCFAFMYTVLQHLITDCQCSTNPRKELQTLLLVVFFFFLLWKNYDNFILYYPQSNQVSWSTRLCFVYKDNSSNIPSVSAWVLVIDSVSYFQTKGAPEWNLTFTYGSSNFVIYLRWKLILLQMSFKYTRHLKISKWSKLFMLCVPPDGSAETWGKNTNSEFPQSCTFEPFIMRWVEAE